MTEQTILHVLQSTNLGGTEHAAIRAMKNLQPLGARFRLATPRPCGGSWPQIAAIDPAAAAFACRGRRFVEFDARQFLRFRRHVRELEGQSEATWISGASAACLLACRTRGRKTVLSHHVSHFDKFGDRSSWTMWKGFYEGLCRHVDAVTYPSEFTRAEALRIAPWLRSRAVVVHNGYDVHYAGEEQRRQRQRIARQRLGLDADAVIVGNAGRLDPAKRFDIFLATAARVGARLPDTRFVVCGGGPAEAELKQLAAALGIAERTRFAGWVTEMEPWYQAMDILLFNSDGESIGGTPFEAASHGCAIVASLRYGGLGEFLIDGRNSWFSGRHDPDALADAVCDLVGNPQTAARFRGQAATDLAEHFSMAGSAAFFAEFFGLRDASSAAIACHDLAAGND